LEEGLIVKDYTVRVTTTTITTLDVQAEDQEQACNKAANDEGHITDDKLTITYEVTEMVD
jgi:hypothetical protein